MNPVLKFRQLLVLTIGVVLFWSALVAPDTALARISGEISIGYEDYSENTATVNSSKSSFHQLYSLLYDKRGRSATLGSYEIALGYELASLNLSEKDTNSTFDSKISSGHLLYSGDYRFASKKIPLNVSLYSKDLSRLSFMDDTYDMVSNYGDRILPDGVTTQIIGGGSRRSSGVSIAFGERKSDSLTAKYPRFSELPRILIDFREESVQDLKNVLPEHYRTRYLTASMVKDSVWVTYRQEQLRDFLHKSSSLGIQFSQQNDYDDRSIRIGTVTNYLQREWINLTNWISISADGGMVKRHEPERYAYAATQYDVNLFASVRRDRWQARTFNTYRREIDGDLRVDEELKLPLYVNGTWGVDNNWMVRFEHKDDRFSASGFNSKDIYTAASARLETFKRSPFTLVPSLSLAINEINGINKATVQGRVETSSTRRFSDKVAINASYDITSITEDAADANDQLTQVLYGKIVFKPEKKLVVSADQRLTISFGTADNQNGPIATGEGFASSGTTLLTRRTDPTSDYIRSITSADVAWAPTARVNAYAKGSLDVYDVKGSELDTVMALSGGIDYALPKYAVGAKGNFGRRSYGGYTLDEVAISGYAQYAPSQFMNSSVRAIFSQTDETGNKNHYSEIKQQFTYLVSSRSFNRKMLELTQQATYIDSSETAVYGSAYTGLRQLSLQGKYFFTTNIFASAIARYSLLDPGNVSEWMTGASLGAQYRLLQANLDYYQGRRSGGNDYRVEKRFSANLKKQF